MEFIYSFLFAGILCLIGQIILDNTKLLPGHITSLFVVIGAALDTFSIYDLIEYKKILEKLKQASEMANIYREILSSVSDTYATLISNNLNIAMKILTSITIIFSVPTMVASFLGMNVHLGIISDLKYGFLIIIGFCVIVSIIIALIFKKKKLL